MLPGGILSTPVKIKKKTNLIRHRTGSAAFLCDAVVSYRFASRRFLLLRFASCVYMIHMIHYI